LQRPFHLQIAGITKRIIYQRHEHNKQIEEEEEKKNQRSEEDESYVG
jgi:hypothetical protein